MSWLMLYARSRRFAITVLILLVGASGAYVLTSQGQLSVKTLVLVMVLSVTSASAGLVDQDPALGRTAAFSWPPRRAAHLIGFAVLVGVISLGLNELLASDIPAKVIIRDAAGLVGLLGLGVTLFGGRFGWCLPFAPFFLAYVPHIDQVSLVGWLVQPVANGPASLIAVIACAAGLAGYSIFGARAA